MHKSANEEALFLQSAESLRFIFESVPNAIIIDNRDGLIVSANSATERLFGYHRSELLGHPTELLYPKRFQSQYARFREEAIASPIAHSLEMSGEMCGLNKQGTEFPISLTLAPLATLNGLFAISEVVDVTLRKKVEAKALRLREIEVQESARRHLAGELHDELGQLLSAIYVNLQTTKEACGFAVPQLGDSILLIEQAIEQVRGISLDLRPAMLDDLGLINTLRWFADRHTQRAGLLLHFDTVTTGHGMTSSLVTTCYRFIQEALTNIVRHAKARHVWIEFHEDATAVHLFVRDDGVGFDRDSVDRRTYSEASFGVRGMRRRVELLGGKFEITSHLAGGTVVQAWIPLLASDSSGMED